MLCPVKGGGRMKRVSDPEIRRKQILETAMRLFYEKGYEETSLEDIAKELHVVKSLCYRYFASKQTLLDAVLEEYTEECCRDFILTLHDASGPVEERLKTIMERMLAPEEEGRYHAFFHKLGNEAMHERLASSMCRRLTPHLAEELEKAGSEAGAVCGSPWMTAEFLLNGCFGVWQNGCESPELKVRLCFEMTQKLLGRES